MIFHKFFIFVWMGELIFGPILALLDLGFSYNINSNFYARFIYISAFAACIFYLFVVKIKVIAHPLNLVFFMAMVVGLLKGLWEGTLLNITNLGSPVVLSHIFYVIMPVAMLSYGWFFFEDYERSEYLQGLLSKVMYFSFYFGIGIVLLFVIASKLEFANYDALGLWNFVYSAPYLLYQPYGAWYLSISILATLFAGKRGILVIMLVYVLIGYFLTRGFRILWILVVLGVLIIFYTGYIFPDIFNMETSRLLRTLYSLQEGDFDGASAGRFIESISALEHLNSSAEHLLFGAGFGAQFLPWPDLPEYRAYLSHYTHFGVISYAWIGGVLLPLVIYAILVGSGVSLILKIRRGHIKRSHYHFVYWLWGIIVISTIGAVLMNNVFLWFIVGCCLNLNRRSA
jgi:hypothetical protein